MTGTFESAASGADENEAIQHVSRRIFRRLVEITREIPADWVVIVEDADDNHLQEFTDTPSGHALHAPGVAVEWLSGVDEQGVCSLFRGIVVGEEGLSTFSAHAQVTQLVGNIQSVDGQRYYGPEMSHTYVLLADGSIVSQVFPASQEAAWLQVSATDAESLLRGMRVAEQLPDDFDIV